MANTQRDLSRRLDYPLPRIRLCLVHEGKPGLALKPLRSPDDAEKMVEPLKHSPEEHFISLHLNSQNEVIGVHEVSHGTLSSSLVHPREVFKAALLSNSHALVVCHNHPSGAKIYPSSEDLTTTRQLIEAGRLVGVSLLDHLIVSPSYSIYSIRENHPELWQC